MVGIVSGVGGGVAKGFFFARRFRGDQGSVRNSQKGRFTGGEGKLTSTIQPAET